MAGTDPDGIYAVDAKVHVADSRPERKETLRPETKNGVRSHGGWRGPERSPGGPEP
jgi:hypothetical protein